MHAKRILFLAISLAIYILLWNLAFPYFQYLMDADAVGYLTVADRVANNDWHRSINGLWSPLNSWLLVPFIKKGMDGFTVALKNQIEIEGRYVLIDKYFLYDIDLKEISNELYFVNPNSYIDISNIIIKHVNIKKNSNDLRYVKILSDHNLKNNNKIEKFYKNKLT